MASRYLLSIKINLYVRKIRKLPYRGFVFLFLYIPYACSTGYPPQPKSGSQTQAQAQSILHKAAEGRELALEVRRNLYSNYYQSIISGLSKHKFNGAFIVAQNGIILVEEYAGLSNIEKKEKIDSLTQFCIASLSKQITAALVLQEYEQKHLQLTDTVSHILKDMSDTVLSRITVHQLLNHSSGYQERNKALKFPPGTGYSYSNAGYNLLGKIIEKTSGKPYDSLAVNLFKTYGMHYTLPATSYMNLNKDGNIAIVYNGEIDGKIEPVADHINRLNTNNIGIPAGGMISTPRDLVIWNQALHTGKILNKENYTLMTQASSERNHALWGEIDYGYGLQIVNEPVQEFFHGGYVKGAPALNIYFPQSGVSIIVMENIAKDDEQFPFIFEYHYKIREFARVVESSLLEIPSFY